MPFSIYIMTLAQRRWFHRDISHILVTNEGIWECFKPKWTEPVFVAVSNLALVKPDKAKAVENYLIQMARFGQLAGKVSIFPNSFSHIFIFKLNSLWKKDVYNRCKLN